MRLIGDLSQQRRTSRFPGQQRIPVDLPVGFTALGRTLLGTVVLGVNVL